MRSHIVGSVAAAAAMIAVGTAVTVSDAVVGYPVFSAQALRYGLAAVILAGSARVTGRRVHMPHGRDWVWLVLLAAIGQALYNVAVVQGVSHAEPAVIAVAVGAVPVVLTVADAIRTRRRPPVWMLAGIALVVAGATLVHGAGHASMLGLGWALVALGCEAGFTLLAIPVLTRLGPVGVATHTCWIAAVQLLLTAIAVDGLAAFPLLSPSTVFAIVYLAVVVTAFAFTVWYFAVQLLGPSRAGLFAGLIPLSAALSGISAGLTTISPALLGGATLVGAGITVALRTPAPTPARAATDRTGSGKNRPRSETHVISTKG